MFDSRETNILIFFAIEFLNHTNMIDTYVSCKRAFMDNCYNHNK